MTWTAAAAPIAVAVLAVLVPGLALAAALRLRGVAALALAGPFGYGVIGVTGVAAAALHVRFGAGPVLVTAAVAVVVAVLGRLALRAAGRPLPAWDTWRPAAFLPVLAAVAVASVAIGIIAFGAVPDPDRISQTYDAVFHLNAAASIVQDGDASSLHLYRLVNPTKTTAFYPAVWHSITALVVELTGVSVPVAANAVWCGTTPVWAAGCAFAASTLFGGTPLSRHGDTLPAQRTITAVVGALVASAFPAFPYLLLDFGTLYPNGLAYTMLPAGLALIAALLPWPDDAPWRPERPAPAWRTLLLLALWFGSAAFTHPRSLVAIGVLAVPMVVAWFAGRMRRLAARDARGRRRARSAVAGVIAGVLLLAVAGAVGIYHYYDLAHRPIADHLNGAPALAREDFWQALLQGLLGTTLVSPTQSALPIAPLVAAALLAALVAAVAHRGLRWPVVTVVVVALLYAAAAGSDSDVAKVATGLWDKDKFRIVAMLPTIAVPLVAWLLAAGGVELATALRGRRARRSDPRPVTVAAVVAAGTVLVVGGAWIGPSLDGVRQAVGTVFALPSGNKDYGLLDVQQQSLLERVGRYVPAGQVIADDPWDGSALAWALGGRQTLFPHLGGYWGAQRILLGKHLDDWRTNTAVCPAVRALDVHWLAVDDQKFRRSHPEAKAFVGIDRMAKGPGVELVARDGGASLYRITACWR